MDIDETDRQITQLRAELGSIQKHASTIRNSPAGRAEARQLGSIVREKAALLAELDLTNRHQWLDLQELSDRELTRMARLEPFWQEYELLIDATRTASGQDVLQRCQDFLARYGDYAPSNVQSPIREALCEIRSVLRLRIG